ncbi:MAG: CDP-glucose 4,6-dehydratase [Acidobacteriaceae bacterium]
MVSPNEEGLWAGRRVFLTGHTGFKGSWMALWLTQLGATVCGYALDPPTTHNLFQVARVGDLIQDVRADICDLERLCSTMKEFEPEVVFHMAAQPLVRRSYAEPVVTYATNVMGTVNLLEAVRHTPSVKAVVCITTDKCYENREWQWGYREVDRLGGHDPYSNSKACAELVCSSYRDSFFPNNAIETHGVALATARAGNVIGGGDWAEDRLIPDLVRGFVAGEEVLIRHPHAIRPWQHVMEPLRGYIVLAERLLVQEPDFAAAWNFGPREEDAQTVEWIVRYFAQRWSPNATWRVDNGAHPHEASYLKLDCARAHNLLGWRPSLNLSSALELIVEWFKKWQSGADMRQITMEQIATYQRLSSLHAGSVAAP